MLGIMLPRCPVCRRGIAGVTRGYRLELLHSRLKTFAESWPQVLSPQPFDPSIAGDLMPETQDMLPRQISEAVKTFQTRLDNFDDRLRPGAATMNVDIELYEQAELGRRPWGPHHLEAEEQTREDDAGEVSREPTPSEEYASERRFDHAEVSRRLQAVQDSLMGIQRWDSRQDLENEAGESTSGRMPHDEDFDATDESHSECI
jgi:hypothetical protein